MEDEVLQEVKFILNKMKENKKNWRTKVVYVIIKFLCAFIITCLFVYLIFFVGLSIFSYIKIFGLSGDAIIGLIAYTSLVFSILFVKYPEPRIDFIMHHVKNDTRIHLIITSLQKEVLISKMSLQSINIVEHKCQTYLQIRYKK